MRDQLTPIIERMLALLPSHPEQLIWSPARAIRQCFPSVALKPLPPGSPFASEVCQCDGYYEHDLVPEHPWILYRDVAPERVRFTLLHELGHHLIWKVDPGLLELIDAAAGSEGDVTEIEERLCQRFAATLLVSDKLLDHVLRGPQPTVSHIRAVRRLSPASWQAIAVRVAQRMPVPGAVLLIRSPGQVHFVATSPRLAGTWPATSRVGPGGPLDHALQQAAHNVRDTFAWGLPWARPMWCSIRRAHPGLAIAIMSVEPFIDGDDEPIPDTTPIVTPATTWQPGAGSEEPMRVGGLVTGALKPGEPPERETLPHRAPGGGDRVRPPAAESPRALILAGLEQVRRALQPGSLTLLASRPSQGKSALGLGLAVDMARSRGVRVGLACLELRDDEVTQRVMAAAASVDLDRLRGGRLDHNDWGRLTRSLPAIVDAPITFLPTRSAISLADLTEHCLRLKRRGQLDLLLVDYIQLLAAELGEPGAYCDPHRALARLKHLAIELDLAVIAVSQLNRRIEERRDKRPELEDLSEHRAAREVADLIGLLRRCGCVAPDPRAWDGSRAAELMIVLNRIGPTGMVHLEFAPSYCRMTEMGRFAQPTCPASPHSDIRGPGPPMVTEDRSRPGLGNRTVPLVSERARCQPSDNHS